MAVVAVRMWSMYVRCCDQDMQLDTRQRRVVLEHELREGVQQHPREGAVAVATKNEEADAAAMALAFARGTLASCECYGEQRGHGHGRRGPHPRGRFSQKT